MSALYNTPRVGVCWRHHRTICLAIENAQRTYNIYIYIYIHEIDLQAIAAVVLYYDERVLRSK